MKAKIFLILIILCCNYSCREDNTCSKDSYLGNWIGTKECKSMDIVNTTVNIVNGDNDIELKVYEDTFTEKVVEMNDCTFLGSEFVVLADASLSGSFDGKTLRMNYKFNSIIGSEKCFYILTKKP